MTKADLLKFLEKYDDNTHILIHGNRRGLGDVHSIQVLEIWKVENPNGFYYEFPTLYTRKILSKEQMIVVE